MGHVTEDATLYCPVCLLLRMMSSYDVAFSVLIPSSSRVTRSPLNVKRRILYDLKCEQMFSENSVVCYTRLFTTNFLSCHFNVT